MSRDLYAKTAFERECGGLATFERAVVSPTGIDFTFRINRTGRQHTIGTNPKGGGRAAIEEAAAQSGRWAKVMAEKSAA